MDNIVLKVLGTAQDGGYPHIGCKQSCCQAAWDDLNKKRLVSSIAIIDRVKKDCWIIDASPDIKIQINMIMDFLNIDYCPNIKGVFLTHAHTGHYSGLLEFGKETMNSSNIPVYAMPKMGSFIKSNSAFNFLINSNNIYLKSIIDNIDINLNQDISIRPFLVPHRNEMSETVGYRIFSMKKSIVYLPDIDSWEDWDYDIIDIIKDNDILLLDGTFYQIDEVKNRKISEIPHPTISHSMDKFSVLNKHNRNKIYFTHLNHTNIALHDKKISRALNQKGYNIANDGYSFTI